MIRMSNDARKSWARTWWARVPGSLLLAAVALLALAAAPAAAQDNFSDITHPDPAEVASSVVSQAVQTGQVDPQSPDFQAQVQAVVEAAVETGGGGMSEGAVRQQLGNVATSILVRAGMLSFQGGGGGPPGSGPGPEAASVAPEAQPDMDPPASGSELSDRICDARVPTRVGTCGQHPGRKP